MSTSTLVLGLQGTVDYEVALDRSTLEALVRQWGVGIADLDPRQPVDSERALLCVLLGHLQRGIGGERFVASSSIVEDFAARFPTRITLGGTPLRAALAMRAVGVPALMHLVSTDDNVRRLLPGDLEFITSATRDTLDPHLILQFAAGDRVTVGDTDIVAPHPNRLIIANDPPARNLLLSPELGPRLQRARVFLLSGLNSIQERHILEERLATLAELIAGMPPGSVVLLEDAGYHRDDFRPLVRAALLPVVDVASMNEDELQEVAGRPLDLLDPEVMAEAVAELVAAAPGTVHVVHTKYYSLAAGPGAARWTEPLRGGIAMASTRYLHGDELTAERYAATAALPPQPVGVAVGDAIARRLRELLGAGAGAPGLDAAGLDAPGPDAPGLDAVAVPGLQLATAEPTTIGLGDTFVGGFVAALAREEASP